MRDDDLGVGLSAELREDVQDSHACSTVSDHVTNMSAIAGGHHERGQCAYAVVDVDKAVRAAKLPRGVDDGSSFSCHRRQLYSFWHWPNTKKQ